MIKLMSSVFLLLCIFLICNSSDYSKLQFQTIRYYPPQWQQLTPYSMKYLNTEYTIKQRGTDLLAFSSLLLQMEYDMHPTKLNAYIMEKNGTFNKGQQMITYYPGGIINWDGFEEFQIQYLGQFDRLEEFTILDTYNQRIPQQFSVIVQFNDIYIDGQIQRPQSQYGFIQHIQSLDQMLYKTLQQYKQQFKQQFKQNIIQQQSNNYYNLIIYILNPSNPNKDELHFSDANFFIVFRKKHPIDFYSYTCRSTYQKQVAILSPEGPSQCIQAQDFQLLQDNCNLYVKISQQQIICHSCSGATYSDYGTCVDCPDRCLMCKKNKDQEIQCIKCQNGYMNSPFGCIIQQQFCKQIRHTSDGIQCLECFEGSSFNNITKKCVQCQADCYKCQDYYNCLQCYAPYYVNNGWCRLEQSYVKTLGCLSDLYEDRCLVCSQNYTIIGGRCIDCLSQHIDKEYCHSSIKQRCLKWWPDGSCAECKPQYRYSGSRLCMIDPDEKCFLSLHTSQACSNCQSGYYVNNFRRCVPCQGGYTDPRYPYYCLKCKSPENDHNNQCQVYSLNNQCLCSKYSLYFILKIQASSHNNFFQNSKYRQSKLNEALAFYLNIQWFSIKSDNFEFIKSGDEAYYVFVGHIVLTVGNFQNVKNLQNIEQKLKSSIFDFYDFPIISVFAQIGPLNKIKVVQKEEEKIQPKQQAQEIQNTMIAVYLFGGLAVYVLVIFMFNLIKNKIKSCKKSAKIKNKSECNLKSKQKQVKEQHSKRKFQINLVSIADEDL